jgi:omega-amidase
VALVQSNIKATKQKTLQHIGDRIEEASASGSDLVILPECFNSPYGAAYFREYGELVGPIHTDPLALGRTKSDTIRYLSLLAKRHSVYIVGGKQNIF